MRPIYFLSAALLLASAPANAFIKVTNLSGTPQSVSFSVAGSDTTRVVAANETMHFIGLDGMLALNDPSTIARAKTATPGPAGKLLGDLVASNRTSRIPARDGDIFVIWPDGRMIIQRRNASGSIR